MNVPSTTAITVEIAAISIELRSAGAEARVDAERVLPVAPG